MRWAGVAGGCQHGLVLRGCSSFVQAGFGMACERVRQVCGRGLLTQPARCLSSPSIPSAFNDTLLPACLPCPCRCTTWASPWSWRGGTFDKGANEVASPSPVGLGQTGGHGAWLLCAGLGPARLHALVSTACPTQLLLLQQLAHSLLLPHPCFSSQAFTTSHWANRHADGDGGAAPGGRLRKGAEQRACSTPGPASQAHP